jgi:subfamily B ATP-binding cassette protein MsbA
MIPLAGLSAKTLGKRVGKVTTQAQEKSGFLTTYLVELFKNHKLIKIFQKENYENSRANLYLEQLKDKNKKIQVVFVRMSPIMETLTGVMIAVLIFYSGKLMAQNELDINNFFSFLAAMMLAYQPVRSLSTLNMVLNQGLSAASRILPIIDNENKINDIENAKELNLKEAKINFENIKFSYDSEEGKVLDTISLEFTGGKMTSLVGHSGSGKSTILNLIPRFYDPDKGNVKIDNQDIKELTISSVRSSLALVSQEPVLFDMSIHENILYGKPEASKEEVIDAAKAAAAHEFISELPKQYETIVGEKGYSLSGGQKQRISIARAFLKNAPILLLDEATSSLDTESEHLVQNAISVLMKDRTTLVIAHRLSTIINSDQIIVLDSGSVAEIGTHEELLKKNGVYKKLYEREF